MVYSVEGRSRDAGSGRRTSSPPRPYYPAGRGMGNDHRCLGTLSLRRVNEPELKWDFHEALLLLFVWSLHIRIFIHISPSFFFFFNIYIQLYPVFLFLVEHTLD